VGLIDEISKPSIGAISEAVTYAFARTAVRDALDYAIEETGAEDWDGNTGCFTMSRQAFDAHWKKMREGNCELSTIAAPSILNALLEGTYCELSRLGCKYAPAVLRHIKENLEHTMQRHRVTIGDDTICGDIWITVCILVSHYLNRVIPDSVARDWDKRLAEGSC